MIALARDLVALDVETHAKISDARLVEIGFVKLFADGREPRRWRSFIDPGVPIDPEATAVHGIADADVAGAPRFEAVAPSLATGFHDCDYCGYNVRFDLQAVERDMRRANVAWSWADARLVDALRLWHLAEPRTLTAAVEKFLGREPSSAHRALGDAEDAWDVANAILEKFPGLPQAVDAIHEASFPRDPNAVDPDGKLRRVDGVVVLGFGKHRGRPLASLPRDYLAWILKADFSDAVKQEIRKYL